MRARRATEQSRDHQLVAEQHDGDGERDRVRKREPDPEVELALRDQALHDVEAVGVEQVEERGREKVERAAEARIDVRERDRQQRQDQREDGHRDAPEQLGALGVAVGQREHLGRDRLARGRERARDRRLEHAPEALELDDAEVRAAGAALVAAAVLQHDVARSVGACLEPRDARHGRLVLRLVDRVQEDVADRPVEGVDALDEDDDLRPPELAEEARRDERELVARLELALELELPLLGPGRQEQRQGDDRDQERRREQHDRPQERRQRLSRGLPDDHLAVAVPARERQQHGQEDRDRQQDVEPGEGVEAQEREDAVGGHGAAGRLREQAQHQVGEQDGGQDQEKPDRCRRQFPGQRTAKDHDAGKSFDFFAVICR
jgi:hypothetical protein